MHSQSDSDMLIVRVRGPWGISRIKCHKNDSLADLKRYTSERVLGLPRSSTSIAFFRDQNCSQLYHGDDSSTLRRLKVENGDVLYARPTPNFENVATDEEYILNSQSSASKMNDNLNENNNGTSTSNLSNSRLLQAKNNVSKDFAASLIIHPSLDPGENGTRCLIDGSLKILANAGFSKTAQNINRRIVCRSNNNQESNNHNQYSSKHFVDPTMNKFMLDSFSKPVCLSWGNYLKSRGWSAGNNNCFAFDLDAIPKAQVIRRGGAPNTIPQSISLKKQHYRHVDYVEFFNLNDINNFVTFWLDHGMLMQRVGMLYGRYENDENTNDTIVLGGKKNNRNNNDSTGLSTKVVIHGIYEPPQTVNITGSVQLLPDSDENDVSRILKAAGLERVGWVFTHPPRNQAITALEAHLMAKFQNMHLKKDEITGLNRSQFVSLTITKNVAGKIVPRAFMVSDQGMVLERSKLWAKGTDLYKCKLTKSLTGKILPAVIRGDSVTHNSHNVMSNKPSNSSSSSQQVLKEFEPDLILVPIPCGQVRLNPVEPAMVAAQRYQSRQLFYHAKFPVENRVQFGEIQNENNVRVFLLQNEHQTMEQRISDFHLLLCLPKLFTIDIAISIAKSIGKKTTLDDYCRAVINAFMKHKTI
jgi:nuclear protein localization protein 4 homolog